MEDLVEIYKYLGQLDEKLADKTKEYLVKLRGILHRPAVLPATTVAEAAMSLSSSETLATASPQQIKKRIKRLSLLDEDEEFLNKSKSFIQNSNMSEKLEEMEQDTQKVVEPAQEESHQAPEAQLQPPAAIVNNEVPPPAPVDTHEFLRPQRAAKLKSEKNLKEPALNKKLRRPDQPDSSLMEVRVKKENEERQSQMLNGSTRSKKSSASVKSTDSSLLMLPEKAPSIVELLSETENEDGGQPNVPPSAGTNEEISSEKSTASDSKTKDERQLRVKIKREKISLSGAEEKNPGVTKAVVVENDLNALITVPKPKMIITKAEPIETTTLSTNSTIANTTSSKSTASVPHTKKSKKKKDVPHVPIKVERFSDLDPKPSPIASRTRSGSTGHFQRQASVYEDAIDQPAATGASAETNPPSVIPQVPQEAAAASVVASSIANQTITVSASTSAAGQPNATMIIAPSDATFTSNPTKTTKDAANPAAQTTFVVENPNATVTIATKDADATFNVAPEKRSPDKSKDNQSMNTDDDSYKSPQTLLPPPLAPAPKPVAMKSSSSAKAYKMPTRTNELFNPLVQSPVKKKVEAFEAAAVQQLKPLRAKRTKENALPTSISSSASSSNITPNFAKLIVAPALGRFLTPTQSSNVTPNASATMPSKKLASSASKIMPFPKTQTSSLKATNGGGSSSTSSSSKAALSRENSCDDFRRGLHQMVEERKRQRELKHLLAAQQREAKEKERAERVAKLAKEREEKRLKKQAEPDQKKKALDEIQRKLKQCEEQELLKQAQAKSKAIQEQERELLQQMKPPKMKPLPPVPKFRKKYTFEMLHEDDSTDDEDKVTYKRPPPPTWSRSTVRGPAIHVQQYWPTDIIDSFFSVQAMSPDLKLIFPNIDERHLKRNSSALWSTPPRYSELPKY